MSEALSFSVKSPNPEASSSLGLPLEALVLEALVEECHERNRASDEPAPPEVMDRMAEQWEPGTEEGIAARVINGEEQEERRR